TFTLTPIITQIEQAMNVTFLDERERAAGYYVKFDLKGLLRGNLQARTAFYTAMLDRGVYNADDVLDLEDQNPQPDKLGQAYMLPLNMVNKRMVVGNSMPLTINPSRMRNVTPPRLIITDEQRYIAQRSSAQRRRVTIAYTPLWESYAKGLLEEEADAVRTGIKNWLANGLKAEFKTWLGTFYDRFRERIDTLSAPLLSSYADEVLPIAEQEAGSDADLKTQMDKFLSAKGGYRETFVLRHVRHSQGSLSGAVTDAEDPEAAAEAVLEDWQDIRPERLRIHESIRAESAFARNVFVLAGVTKLMSVSYGKSCPYCLALDGKVIEIQGAFLDPGDFQPDGADRPLTITSIRRHPPYHDGCLPGHSRVLAEGVSSASKRWYDGDLVVIQTARGHKLSVTPNHPILTPQGWIAAGALDEGSSVLSRSTRDRIQLGNGDCYDSPARIEDVAEALLRDREMVAVPVPTAAENFHGDGAGSKVAIVGTNRQLWNRLYALLVKQGNKVSFIRRDSDPTQLSGLSGQALFSECLFSLRRRTVGRSSLSFPLRGRHLPGSHSSGLAIRTERDSVLSEMTSNHAPVDSERQRQAIDRLSGQVAPDQVVSIKRNSFHGYVFNLQTDSGFYVAEGIIAHNCDCGIEVGS
ncbi:MAG TPA: phage portal protein, partial [Armatimonadota bacterium]|nr:phage portal protein [Armatimonadota bacterium]